MVKTRRLGQLVTFLLVEDDEDHAHLVIRSLQKARVGNIIHHVRDGQEALAFLRQEEPYAHLSRPDIVLLDLKLPKVDGHEVLRVIKADPRLQTTPVVVMTTSDAEADRERAYQNNANSYLVKPLDFQKFHTMVEDLSLYWGVWNQPPGTD